MDFFRRYKNHIFIGTIVVFLLGMFAGFGSYLFGDKGSPNDPIVEVNGEKVPVRLFYSHFDRAMAQQKPGTNLDEAARKQKRDEVIRDLVQQVVFEQQAKQYGIVVPDQQVMNSLTQVPAFQDKGTFSLAMYARALQEQLKSTPQDFENEQRQEIAFYKLRWLIQSCIKVTDAEAQMAFAAAHNGKMTGFEKESTVFRDKLWQDKVMWDLNQWFVHLSQHLPVKAHLDNLGDFK